ncbi:uncharacterized mitochondrial protein AtMg00810-like [Telopea speciosissima]|uniref:uncharacterized mitochondrial protein AtMg00810-like n=1 Tax=Telopea speciosissima TaxID=54955 RepID=UPI001CC4113B|nr:uncharacterized mitochondrial protein AtMg00810-like [Telopea speciosissima]
MLGYKPIDSPIEFNHQLGSPDGDFVDKERYQCLVGRLIYLSHTRPDIAYAVGVISRFLHNPKTTYLGAVYRILRYLKSAAEKEILFLDSFVDADWAGSVGDRRSTTDYCTFFGDNLVTWRSKKQSVVSRSSAEAEYRLMVQGVCELMWLKKLLQYLKIAP